MEKSKEILELAAKLISGDRHEVYGSAIDNFSTTADLWNVYWARRVQTMEARGEEMCFKPHDVAAFSCLIKFARLARTPDHPDSKVDIAGYIALMEEVING